MDKNFIYVAGTTPACAFARTYLRNRGLPVADRPGPDVGHLILDVPSFGPKGNLRAGMDAAQYLTAFSGDIRIYGGNLHHPALAEYRTVDFLQDPDYLARNAYITAECALDVAFPYLSITLRNCPILIIGWGRIGKCLAQLLKAIGADVTVAARKETDWAMLQALGCRAAIPASLAEALGQFRLIFNTAPELVVHKEQAVFIRKDAVIIDLASQPGIEHDNAVIARGLPGIHMPESTGKLIAETFLRYYDKEVRP